MEGGGLKSITLQFLYDKETTLNSEKLNQRFRKWQNNSVSAIIQRVSQLDFYHFKNMKKIKTYTEICEMLQNITPQKFEKGKFSATRNCLKK